MFIILVFCACYSKTKVESQREEKIKFLIQYMQTKTAEQLASGVIKYPKREDGMDWFPGVPQTMRIDAKPPIGFQPTLTLYDAVVELGRVGDEGAIPALAKLRGIDEPYNIKFEAMKAIEQIQERGLAKRLDKSYQLPVDKKTIEKYYDKHESEFLLPAKVKVKSIVLPSQKEAEQILAKLNAKISLDDIAKENSLEIHTPDYFARGRMAKEYEEAAFELTEGRHSNVVKIRDGTHYILEYVDRIPAKQLSLEEARDWIYYKLLAELGEDLSPQEEEYDRNYHGTKVSTETKMGYRWSRELYLRGDYDEAIKLANRIRKSPESFPRGAYEMAGLLIGQCYEELTQYEKAIEAYARMRPTGCCGGTAVPRRLSKNIGLGRSFEAIGNCEQATRHYVVAVSSDFAGCLSYKDKLPAERGLSRLGVNLTRLYMGMVWVYTQAALTGLSRLGGNEEALLLVEFYQRKDISELTWSSDSNRAGVIFALGMIGCRDKKRESIGPSSHWWSSHWGEPMERNLKPKTREKIKKTLLEASRHESARVRLSATHALDYIGDASVVPRLKEMLKDADAEVRKAAEAALRDWSNHFYVPPE